MPIMHTETNILDTLSVDWLKKQWANAYRLKQDGVPLIGFTWYSLIDQVDWDTALLEDNNRIHNVGLYDINRNIREVGKAYKKLIGQSQNIFANEYLGIFIQ